MMYYSKDLIKVSIPSVLNLKVISKQNNCNFVMIKEKLRIHDQTSNSKYIKELEINGQKSN